MGRLVRWKLEEWWRFIGWIEEVGIGDRCLVFGVRGEVTSWIDENEGSAASN